jgi:hypothetical protein
MKRKSIMIFIFAGIILITGCNSSATKNNNNYFEGKLTYDISYIPTTSSADTAFLKAFVAKGAEMSFKEGSYNEIFYGGGIRQEIYNQKENRDYNLLDSKDTLYWLDCSKKSPEPVQVQINKKKKTILGIECDELVFSYPSKTIRYYFNSDTLKIDPDWYKNFTFQNKSMQMQKMGSLYLGIEMEYPDFIITWTTVKIQPQKIDEKEFIIPKSKMLKEEK